MSTTLQWLESGEFGQHLEASVAAMFQARNQALGMQNLRNHHLFSEVFLTFLQNKETWVYHNTRC